MPRGNPLHREDILNAAERLLGRSGYHRMRVEDIAREAGVGKGTIYLYFDSKEAAVLGTVDRIVEAVCAEMSRIARDERPPAERLRDMLLARILIRFDRIAPYQQGLNDLLSAIRPALLDRRRRHFARESALLAPVIAEFSAHDCDRLARSMLLATNDFLPYALSPAELGNRRHIERDASEVIDLLIAAIAGAPR